MDNDDRVISPVAGLDDSAAEGALRPKDLQEFIGQERVRQQISAVLSFDHSPAGDTGQLGLVLQNC